MNTISREEGLNLLKKYNKEPFHILHGLTVEGVMRYFAKKNMEMQAKNFKEKKLPY